MFLKSLEWDLIIIKCYGVKLLPDDELTFIHSFILVPPYPIVLSCSPNHSQPFGIPFHLPTVQPARRPADWRDLPANLGQFMPYFPHQLRLAVVAAKGV
jgi:hypothetical protein